MSLNWFKGVLLDFNRVLLFFLDLTGFYCVSLCVPRFYGVLISFNRVKAVTGFYLILLGFTGFYWVFMVFTGLHWAIRCFFLGVNGVHWVSLGLNYISTVLMELSWGWRSFSFAGHCPGSSGFFFATFSRIIAWFSRLGFWISSGRRVCVCYRVVVPSFFSVAVT